MSTLMDHFAACVMKDTYYLVMDGHVQILMNVQWAHMNASTFVRTLLADSDVCVVKDIS